MWLERMATVLTMVGTIAGGFLYMDEHYASAADLKRLEQNIKRDRMDAQAKELENRIFELEFKQRATPKDFKALDSALLDRYRDALKDLQKRARDLDR